MVCVFRVCPAASGMQGDVSSNADGVHTYADDARSDDDYDQCVDAVTISEAWYAATADQDAASIGDISLDESSVRV